MSDFYNEIQGGKQWFFGIFFILFFQRQSLHANLPTRHPSIIMPPKSGKMDKAKAKMVEDKTFGLKNKSKSSKVAKYVKEVEAQVKNSGKKQVKESIHNSLISYINGCLMHVYLGQGQ